MACGTSVSQSGNKPGPPQWKCRTLMTGPPGTPQCSLFLSKNGKAVVSHFKREKAGRPALPASHPRCVSAYVCWLSSVCVHVYWCPCCSGWSAGTGKSGLTEPRSWAGRHRTHICCLAVLAAWGNRGLERRAGRFLWWSRCGSPLAAFSSWWRWLLTSNCPRDRVLLLLWSCLSHPRLHSVSFPAPGVTPALHLLCT